MIKVLLCIFLMGNGVSSFVRDRNVPYRNLYVNHTTGKGYLQDFYPEPYSQKDSRIYYGEYADDAEFPWVVDLYAYGTKDKDGFYATEWMCVATVIDEEWVITAAHCIINATGITLTFGVTDFCAENENEIQMFMADKTKFHLHPDFVLEWLVNDIALIQLPYPLELDGTFIDRAYLPSGNETYSIGDEVEVVGWGSDDFDDDSHSCVLNKKVANVVDVAECYYDYGGDIKSSGGTVCTTGGTVCRGDTGGPLNSYTTAAQTIYGVVSYYYHTDCTYHTVGSSWIRFYMDWIYEVSGVVPPPPCQGCTMSRDTLEKYAKKIRGYCKA